MGDLLDFSAPGGGLTVIQHQKLSAVAANIDFNNIPQSFRHLLMTGIYTRDAGAAAENTRLRFNGDAGANYDFIDVFGTSAGSGASVLAATTSALVATAAPSAAVGIVTTFELLIPYYTQTTFQQSVRSHQGVKGSNAAVDFDIGEYQNWWRTLAAVASMRLFNDLGNNFVANSQFTLYGVS